MKVIKVAETTIKEIKGRIGIDTMKHILNQTYAGEEDAEKL